MKMGKLAYCIAFMSVFLAACQTSTTGSGAKLSDLYDGFQPLTNSRSFGAFTVEYSPLNQKNYFTASVQPVVSDGDRKQALTHVSSLLDDICAKRQNKTGKTHLPIVLSKYISFNPATKTLLVPAGCPILKTP